MGPGLGLVVGNGVGLGMRPVVCFRVGPGLGLVVGNGVGLGMRPVVCFRVGPGWDTGWVLGWPGPKSPTVASEGCKPSTGGKEDTEYSMYSLYELMKISYKLLDK